MPLQLKAGLAVQALAPSVFTRIVRAAGAAQEADEVSERQRNKR